MFVDYDEPEHSTLQTNIEMFVSILKAVDFCLKKIHIKIENVPCNDNIIVFGRYQGPIPRPVLGWICLDRYVPFDFSIFGG